MVRNLALVLRLGVIASAMAMLLFCARAAQAQAIGQEDRYGYIAVPGAPTMPTPNMPAPMAPAPMAAGPQFAVAQPVSPYTNGYQPSPMMSPGAAGYVLGTGDHIKITVFGEDDLSGDYAVDSQGTIRFPLIGQVQATGLTATQLENAIGSALGNGFLRSPRISAQISTYRPFYVVGAVNRPGEYPYGINMTALKAVALAGGFAEHATESTVYVRHQDESTEHEMDTSMLSQIQPGDTVRVKRSAFWDAMDVLSPLSGTAAIAAAATH